MTPLNIAITTLLNGIWLGAILATAMMLLLKFFPRMNPTTRFIVLWMTLLAVVALLATPLTPRASVAEPRIESLVVASPGPGVIPAPAPAQVYRPGPKTYSSHVDAAQSHASMAEQHLEPTGSQNISTNSLPTTSPSEPSLIRIHWAKFPRAMAIVWVVLSLVLLGRLAAGYYGLRSLKSSATMAQPDWQLDLSRLCARHGIRRQPQLFVSSQVSGPMSLGFFRPVILIPRTLLETLSESELEQVVLHELAHLHRRDDWSNLAQKLIEAVLPIQPAVYWLGYQMSLEREMACDDWVITATGTPRPYAAALTKVAELSQWQRAGVLAAGATGNRSQLFRRVRQMLDHTRKVAPRLTIVPLASALAVVVTLTCLSTRAPQLIVFAQSAAFAGSPAQPIEPRAPRAPLAPQSPRAPMTMTVAVLAPRRSVTPAAPASAIAALAPSAPLAPQAELSPMSPSSPLSPPSPTSPASPMSPLAPLAPVASQQSGNSHVQMTTRNGWTSLSITIDGTVEFTDDDTDVKSLPPNGRFRLEDGSLFSKRAYEVRADGAGNLTRSYSVGWSTKPMDDEGRAWLARTLPQVIRDSGIGAGPRVARILRQGGPQLVLTEIGRIHSDGSKRVYLEQLFSQATLKSADLKDAARLIRSISSDGDKAQVIITVDANYFTAEMRSYLFDAAGSISSDGDKRRVLSDIVKKDGGSLDTLASAARAARHISSDGDKAEVLIEMAGPYRPGGGVDMAYFDAANSISSDGDHARVLSKMLASHGDDHNTLTRSLLSAQRISSDGDKARVLKASLPSYSEDASVRKAFFDAANSISSDGDHQQVLVSLAQKQGIGADTVAGIANSAQRISSAGDKARVLIELAGTNVEPARDAFFAAANSINSDGDRSRVLMVVLDKPGISSSLAVAAIQSATGISSDGDKARVFLDAAERYSGDPAVNAALRKAVESLHSDGDYRTVMSRIGRHEASL